MGKKCYYEGCRSDVRYLKPGNPENIKFIPFPKPKTNRDKCLSWISLCRRETDPAKSNFISKIGKGTYICSKHFVGGNGPSEDYPDPISLTCPVDVSNLKSLNQVSPPFEWSVERYADGRSIFSRMKNDVAIMRCTVLPDLTYTLKILDCLAPASFIANLPKVNTVKDVPLILYALNQTNICYGNQSENLVKAFLNGKRNRGRYCEKLKSVFSYDCKLISLNGRCGSCSTYRATLRCNVWRKKQNTNTIVQNMTKEELIEKLKATEAQKRNLERKLSKYAKKRKKGKDLTVSSDDSIDTDLLNVNVKENDNNDNEISFLPEDFEEDNVENVLEIREVSLSDEDPTDENVQTLLEIHWSENAAEDAFCLTNL